MTERKPNRMKGYDYSTPGAYFVTVCAHDRFENRNIFGEIRHGDIIKNPWADIIESCWRELPNHYPHISLDEFVVMPDHIHGIVWINDMNVGNGFKPARNGLKPFPTRKPNHGLAEIVRGLKTFSSRRINEINHNEKFQWHIMTTLSGMINHWWEYGNISGIIQRSGDWIMTATKETIYCKL